MIIEKEVLNLINPKGRRDPKGLAIASASALAYTSLSIVQCSPIINKSIKQ